MRSLGKALYFLAAITLLVSTNALARGPGRGAPPARGLRLPPPPPPPPPPPTFCFIDIEADCHGWVPGHAWFSDNYNGSAHNSAACLARAKDYFQWCGLDRPRDQVHAVFRVGLTNVASQTYRLPPNIWTSVTPTVNPTHLPLGTGKYMTQRPMAPGYVWACDPRAFQFPRVFGNTVGGDWIHATSYDITGKPIVRGQVFHPGMFSVSIEGGRRMIQGNGLPVGVPTGEFPTNAADPAYYYDKNPTALAAQDIRFSLPLNPTLAEQPSCTGLEIGITLDGVELSGPLDSSGRDEMAFEMMDECSGMTQPGGLYHRHALSNCIPHIHERNALVGYALDGFGIFSPYDVNGRELTTKDLDECHGTTSVIPWDGRMVRMYHYVLTRDFPYSPGCFKGTPINNPFPALPPPQF